MELLVNSAGMAIVLLLASVFIALWATWLLMAVKKLNKQISDDLKKGGSHE